MKIKVNEQGYVIGYVKTGEMDGAEEYTGQVPEGFEEASESYKLVNGQLELDEAKQEAEEEKKELKGELEELYEWFSWYDNQVQQYNRSVRMGEGFDEDIHTLDTQAKQNQLRIREIRQRDAGPHAAQ